MTKKYSVILASVLVAISSVAPARAYNLGNVTVKGSGSCSLISGTFPLQSAVFQQTQNGVVTSVYKLGLLATPNGLPLQYIVDTLAQIGSATSGQASVFNNVFLGGTQNGTWSGSFRIDAFANFIIDNVVITIPVSGQQPCVLTLTNGFAVFSG